MIEAFEISASRVKLDESLKKYATKKLANLDKYLSRHARENAQLEVKFDEHKADGQKQNICHATLHLPHEVIRINEAAGNIYASIDIVEVKLKQQIKKYKEIHTDGKRRRQLFARRSQV